MSKFLNEEGLSYFWGKVKDFLKSKYVAIGDAITVGKSTMDKNGFSVKESEKKYSTMDSDALTYTNQEEGTVTRMSATSVSVNGDESCVKMDKNLFYAADGDEEQVFMASKTGVTVSGPNGETAMASNWLRVSANNDSNTELTSFEANKDGVFFIKYDNNNKNRTTSKMEADSVTSPKFVKTDGTAVQILMADGSVKTLNAANGVPTLDANGKIPLEQLGNIDTTLFQVVTALPTTGIVKNRIYLVKSSSTTTQNIYAEYIYTGDVSATYDASKWEKLGEYKSDVDLSGYSKKNETVTELYEGPSGLDVFALSVKKADGGSTTTMITSATQEKAGVMSASDKKALDTLAARYPLSIASLTASPNLLEVGKSSDITFSWSFNNTDFHPITAQTIAVDGAAAVTVDKANKSYKQTALAGATTATTKSAVLKVNDSLTKSVNITYHYPSYIGVVANGATVDATAIKALTKSIEWGKGKTSAISQTNQKIVYAYPVSYGDLTSIKDGNGFQGFSGYTKQTLTIDGQNYNVYVQNIAATSSSTYTFA